MYKLGMNGTGGGVQSIWFLESLRAGWGRRLGCGIHYGVLGRQIGFELRAARTTFRLQSVWPIMEGVSLQAERTRTF